MILDLFAGPGGWDVAARDLDLDVVGIELDPLACATRAAAGLHTIQSNVATYPIPMWSEITGLIASPPCQTFSAAGKREGVRDITKLVKWCHSPGPLPTFNDPRTELVLEPLRWALELNPVWCAWEQVRAVLPIWEACAVTLQHEGWHTWTGILKSERYGVPQTRERAILMAHRGHSIHPPTPTHQEYEPGVPARHEESFFGEILPWVSMAEALGWGAGDRPCVTVTGGGTDTGGAEPLSHPTRFRDSVEARSWVVNTGRDWKPGGSREDAQQIPLTEPAPAVSAKSGGQWVFGDQVRAKGTIRTNEEPAPTISASADNGNFRWTQERPATTIAGDERCFSPGEHMANDGRDNSRMVGRSENTIKLTIADALILQSFPADYPVAGSKTAQFTQIGNAIPPLLARAILKEFI